MLPPATKTNLRSNPMVSSARTAPSTILLPSRSPAVSFLSHEQCRHGILVHLAPTGLLREHLVERPLPRHQSRMESVRLQRAAPSRSGILQPAIVGDQGRSVEIAPSVEKY